MLLFTVHTIYYPPPEISAAVYFVFPQFGILA